MSIDVNIIAVDDQHINILVLEEMASLLGFPLTTFLNPTDAYSYIQTHDVDIMLVDYMMPDMNGIELIKLSKEINPGLIIVMVTAVSDDPMLKVKALEVGATDFLTKPINVAELQAKIKNLTELKKSQKLLENFNLILKEEVDLATKRLIEREHEMLTILSATAEYRDPETGSHIARVAHYSKTLAKLYNLSDEDQNLIFYGSPLHDVGKVGISDSILLKPGKLTDDEFLIMKTHATIGYDILKKSKNPYLIAGAIIAQTHHEKYDGSGYPFGLKGQNIHIFGRITAIADVFDALTSSRPYKKAWSFEEGLSFLKENEFTHFDSDLVTLFIENKAIFYKIYSEFLD